MKELLEQAIEAFEQHAEEDALRLLLEVWRESRSERIAALVEKLSDRLAAGLPPLDGPTVAHVLRRYRPIDMPRLLDSLMVAASQERVEVVGHMLRGLRQWPSDPRLASTLMDLARLPIARVPQVVQGLHGVLLYLRDPRARDTLRALWASLSAGARQGGNIVELPLSREFPALDEEVWRLGKALEEAIDARAEAEARSAPLREALLARVYSQPDDDGARLVLADHLLEQGDPLGEFIMLQCSPQPTKARVGALLKRHGVTWQDPLRPFIEPRYTRFERGFPAAVRMAFVSRQPPPGPAWGTVQEIDWQGLPSEDLVEQWLANPHLHAVTRLCGLDASGCRKLGLPLSLRRLELAGRPPVPPEMFTALSALPHLTWLDIVRASPRVVGQCAESPLALRLERFTALVEGAWYLEATPSEEVTVTATLVRARSCSVLAEAIRSAVGFGTRGLRVCSRGRLGDEHRRVLEAAGAAYARIEWVEDP
ncbi:TIGR02996 domain-containing protein [Pyxidicoccus sp. 3LG]